MAVCVVTRDSVLVGVSETWEVRRRDASCPLGVQLVSHPMGLAHRLSAMTMPKVRRGVVITCLLTFGSKRIVGRTPDVIESCHFL